MLRMDGFDYLRARTWADAAAAWSPEAMYLAGGTDLLPNLKHRIVRPRLVIAVGELPGGVAVEGDELVIGATVTLDVVAADPTVRRVLPALATAAGLVAGPQIRAMGTLGGNVMLDTRCLYYNQTEFWRRALGYCLKAEGTWCHVVGGPKTCVATQSSDTVPVLLAAGASIELLGPRGARRLELRELFQFNGMDHLRIEKGELLTAIRVPVPRPGARGSYQKLRTRDSIDFPQLGLAIQGTWEGDVPTALEIVVGAVNPQPKPVRGLDAFLGRPMDADAVEAVADLVFKQTRPQASTHGDPAWRRQMAAVHTRRGLTALARG